MLRDSIVEMSAEEFSSHVSSLVLSLSETPKFLGKETWRYWSHIDGGFYEFKRRELPDIQGMLKNYRGDRYYKYQDYYEGRIIVVLQQIYSPFLATSKRSFSTR